MTTPHDTDANTNTNTLPQQSSSTTSKQYEITPLPTNPTLQDLQPVISLFKSYASTLNIDLSFQDFTTELSTLPGKYSPSQDGALLLARDISTGDAVGCIALRKLDIITFTSSSSSPPQSNVLQNDKSIDIDVDNDKTNQEETPKKTTTAELKRLFILPQARGTGLGKALAQNMIHAARELGYHEIKLDTLPSMKAAIAMYESLGFRDVRPYCFNPVEGVRFLGLDLDLDLHRGKGA